MKIVYKFTAFIKIINTILLTAIPCLWACLADATSAILISVFTSFVIACVYSMTDTAKSRFVIYFSSDQRNLVLFVHLLGLIMTTLIHAL